MSSPDCSLQVSYTTVCLIFLSEYLTGISGFRWLKPNLIFPSRLNSPAPSLPQFLILEMQNLSLIFHSSFLTPNSLLASLVFKHTPNPSTSVHLYYFQFSKSHLFFLFFLFLELLQQPHVGCLTSFHFCLCWLTYCVPSTLSLYPQPLHTPTH